MVSGVDKFLCRRPTWARNFTCAPDRARKNIGALNKSARPIETQLETSLFVLYNLNSTYSFHFFICFHQKYSQRGFCSLNVVLTPKMCLKDQIFIIQTHSCKGVQKNKLKTWDFTKNKLCHRCFDNNL